ncbi:hypothetical protein ACKKBG_A08845 [Auxenochlorella protothecoides x Auxenochlorella symbiontica]
MKEEAPEGGGNLDTERDAELALSLHRNLNWAGRERSRHSLAREESQRLASAVKNDSRKRMRARSSSSSDGGSGAEDRGTPRKVQPKSPTSPRSGSGSRRVQTVTRPLPRSTLTAAVAQVGAKTSQAGFKPGSRPQVKCFVAGSRWGRLVPRDALSSPSKLIQRLRSGGAGPGEAKASTVLLVAGGTQTVEFKAGGEGGAARDARWAAAARKASRVYIRSDAIAS